jgi:phosphoribosylamine---glycine ligase
VNLLLIGSGGREHAIAWKLRQSPLLTDLHVAPGNAGTAEVGHNVDLPLPRTGANAGDIEAYKQRVLSTARNLKIDFAFVAPDDPLAWGLVDAFEAAGIPAFGPSKDAALLEASKAWAKGFMARHEIRGPRNVTFEDAEAAKQYVTTTPGQFVVKADGAALGKGAIVTSSKDEALRAINELMIQKILGDAGARVVIEERLSAREVSGHAFSDGRSIAPMPLSCDHKTVFEGGRGPNTGGMGVYSPPWWADAALEAAIRERVLQPAVDGMAAEARPFRGIVYPGVFATEDGPIVFEFNARFGDPEAQALLPRLDSDLLEIALACVNQRLHELEVRWSAEASVCVVAASGGYPESYPTGLPITGLDALDPDVRVFHAGTRRETNGSLVTAGGRVLSVVATGPDLESARRKAYANLERVRFEGMHYRRDIGLQE